ncbi:MAG TPA: COX15/CtaA family protein [Bacillales bacterium]|nr:COX15/CtaA family protein [Bacillales bacterium]
MKRGHATIFGLGIATSIGLFIVNAMGFIDTITGSTLGCGKEWPLCDGALVPSVWDKATTIEYTHRLVAMTVILMLIVFSTVAAMKYRRFPRVKGLIAVSVAAVLTEAGLGASSVLFSNPPWVLAFHMGTAFTSFTACVLLTIVVGEIEKTKRYQRNKVALPRFAPLAWFSMIYVFAAIYYGAYVTHSGYGAMFKGWPFPSESTQAAGIGYWIDFGHRLVAFGLFVLVAALLRKSYRLRWVRRDLFIGSLFAFIFTLLQIFSGAYLILSHLSMPAFLSHVTLVSLLFVSVAYLAFQTLPEMLHSIRGSFHKSRDRKVVQEKRKKHAKPSGS